MDGGGWEEWLGQFTMNACDDMTVIYISIKQIPFSSSTR